MATPPPAPSRWIPTPRQLARLLPGLLFFGAGEGLVTHAELGNSPWTVLAEGVSIHTPLSIGAVTVVLSFVVLVLWIALVGLGSGLYINANLGPGPRDGLMTGLHRRTGRPIALVRAGIELTVFTLGALLGGTFGAGTVAFALLVGPAVAAALRLLPGRHAAESRG